MTGVRVLFLGGTGIISSACSWQAVEAGLDLTVVNRGKTSTRPLPPEARVLTADVDDASAFAEVAGQDFDVVVDWLAFTPDQVRARTDALRGRVGQYVFISSASAYQTPPARLPITESTPLRNPFWQYSRNKIACEDLLTALYRDEGYPVTIVRPSHTYDRTLVPFDGGWTIVERMRRGQPVVVHGDGSSLWTLTHHRDFARGLVPLLGHPRTLGEAFQITSDDVLTWDQIAQTLASAAGTSAQIVHVPSDAIAAAHPAWGAGLLGDKTHSAVFDNTKLRRVVPDFVATIPFESGAREIISWYDEDPARRRIDPSIDEAMNTLITRYTS
ncbi:MULTISPECIES: NAD-dependent epimerase/dehydratase family protein [Kribbella]|uniref:Nucleoside-diphosphate-sugar epimerase n=1 Tax=Kribbella pratensis TaxID=2512112 RepID=A0ABY2FPD5_9ACTN|nr:MULTISPECIES: NAD-dependent epimerase/dehydratase family protein [Kribbella]TDW95012.1 nucleoside-diphosphate-sugar epimerase [Kribbella pratensis]TDX03624.1 nucleoside-diphosphate-sugar epimerase [Kribbella sp. VKM Ac-2566]